MLVHNVLIVLMSVDRYRELSKARALEIENEIQL